MGNLRSNYISAIVFAGVGIYFYLYSEYPLFIILFFALSAYQFFITRLFINWKKRFEEMPVETDDVGAEDEPNAKQ